MGFFWNGVAKRGLSSEEKISKIVDFSHLLFTTSSGFQNPYQWMVVFYAPKFPKFFLAFWHLFFQNLTTVQWCPHIFYLTEPALIAFKMLTDRWLPVSTLVFKEFISSEHFCMYYLGIRSQGQNTTPKLTSVPTQRRRPKLVLIFYLYLILGTLLSHQVF